MSKSICKKMNLLIKGLVNQLEVKPHTINDNDLKYIIHDIFNNNYIDTNDIIDGNLIVNIRNMYISLHDISMDNYKIMLELDTIIDKLIKKRIPVTPPKYDINSKEFKEILKK